MAPSRKQVVGRLDGLTPRELQLLSYVANCIDGRGLQPTYRQMQKFMGYKSTNSIVGIVDQLIKKGVIWETTGHGFVFDWKAYRGAMA